MGNLFQKKVWRILSAVCACLLAIVLGFLPWATAYRSLVCSAIGGTTSKVVEAETGEEQDTEYFKDNGMSLDDWIEKEAELTREVQASGSVLLKNDGILPLQKGAKVSAFGYGTVKTVSTGLVRFGTPGQYIDFKTGMEEDGKLQLNPSLYEFYSDNASADPAFNTLNEIDVGLMTDAARADYDEYADAAIVVLSRAGGEAGDLATGDFTGGTKYLALQESEKKMLEEVTAHFDDVIVLINSSYAMELGWLEEYDIDACLMIGAIGYRGFNAVSDILTGATNPSGRLADTWAADSFSAPAMQNFGDYTFANAEAINEQIGTGNNATKYVVETEGIYVGYKYYETRYEDAVLGQGNASSAAGTFASASSWDYDEEVCFPFGYGLSYTTFEQTLVGVRENEDSFELTVSVENTGKVAGKSVVEVYGQSEYTDFDRTNGIEKAAVQLVGFEKTEELAPGATEEVVVTVDKYQLATYDHVVNKGYILEEGDYYLAIGSDSHDALNNILAAKGATGMTDADGNTVSGDADSAWLWSLGSTDTESFRYSETTKRLVTNQFDDADLNYYGDFVTYLTRADWNATYPEPLQLSATQKMIEDLKFTYEKSSNTDTSAFKTEQTTGYTLAMMIGEDYDNPYWEQLIDQMSIDDMLTAVARACKVEIPSVGKPLNYLQDTPTGFNKNSYFENYAGYTFADEDPMTDFKPPQYPTEPVVAGTFNKELVEEFGDAFGEDGLWLNVHHHYAPGANIHRTPYSGRNFEYYSEDGFLSSEMVAYQVRGSRKKGLITYVKHFVLNDQEMNRTGVATFLTEQAMREIYLRGFEGCFTKFYEEGNSTNALMGGFNRIGCVWTGASKAMMTNVIQNEWGFNGICDTDMAAWTHMEAKSGVMAGTTDFAITSDARANEILTDLETDADLYAALREAVHRNLYVIANSQEMNGISSTMQIVPVMTWYQITLITLDVVFGVAFCAGAVLLTVNIYGKKKKEEAK